MLMIPNDGILIELFLDVCEYGAEAMVWDGQGPPRSCGDLEGAWTVWKKGGSANPLGKWWSGEENIRS